MFVDLMAEQNSWWFNFKAPAKKTLLFRFLVRDWLADGILDTECVTFTQNLGFAFQYLFPRYEVGSIQLKKLSGAVVLEAGEDPVQMGNRDWFFDIAVIPYDNVEFDMSHDDPWSKVEGQIAKAAAARGAKEGSMQSTAPPVVKHLGVVCLDPARSADLSDNPSLQQQFDQLVLAYGDLLGAYQYVPDDKGQYVSPPPYINAKEYPRDALLGPTQLWFVNGSFDSITVEKRKCCTAYGCTGTAFVKDVYGSNPYVPPDESQRPKDEKLREFLWVAGGATIGFLGYNLLLRFRQARALRNRRRRCYRRYR